MCDSKRVLSNSRTVAVWVQIRFRRDLDQRSGMEAHSVERATVVV